MAGQRFWAFIRVYGSASHGRSVAAMRHALAGPRK